MTLAKGLTEVPTLPSHWAFEDVAIDEDSPCRAQLCPGAEVCVKSTGACQNAATGCTPACANGTACVDLGAGPACTAVLGKDDLGTYPDAYGAYISLATAPSGPGLVVYDRIHGNLVKLEKSGGAWQSTILDGETGLRGDGSAVDTGDVGIGASLFIGDGGDWHVTYVNGIDETLRYVSVIGGKVGKPEVVDDGNGVTGRFDDGHHVVGDDSYVTVDGSGNVTVFYQDATAGTLREAIGNPGGSGHAWGRKIVPQPGKFAGYFPHPIPGEGRVANFWRSVDKSTKDELGDVSIVAP